MPCHVVQCCVLHAVINAMSWENRDDVILCLVGQWDVSLLLNRLLTAVAAMPTADSNCFDVAQSDAVGTCSSALQIGMATRCWMQSLLPCSGNTLAKATTCIMDKHMHHAKITRIMQHATNTTISDHIKRCMQPKVSTRPRHHE